MNNYIRYTEARGLFASNEEIGDDATTIDNLGNFAITIIGQSWVSDWKKIRNCNFYNIKFRYSKLDIGTMEFI